MAEERERKVDNSSYKERFQFLISVKEAKYDNENIICQRYFKIPAFNYRSLHSAELKGVLDDAVDMIKEDLLIKTNIYTQYTTPSRSVQLTGFIENETPTFLEVPVVREEQTNDPLLAPYDVTFKFVFLVDDKPVYENIWDGTIYPKYVRNSVDITNSDVSYRGRDDSELGFNVALTKKMTQGRPDLVYGIIRLIRDVCSYSYTEAYGDYVTTIEYGGMEHSLTPEDDYIDSWAQYTKKKTKEYFYGKR